MIARTLPQQPSLHAGQWETSRGSAEQVEVHVLLLLFLLDDFLLFLLRGPGDCRASGRRRGRHRIGSGVRLWILKELFDLLDLLEGEVGISDQRCNVLEGVAEGVGEASLRRDADLA